jgi:threonyl-tRNA synthetase
MRFLALHVDHFRTRVTERGRSKVVEEPREPELRVDEALVALCSVERGDEAAPESVAAQTADEIGSLARQLGASRVVLHPFAHLFAQLARPEVAVQVLAEVEQGLRRRGFEVDRTPFGWFNTLELKAKGHPLSRVARILTPELRTS